MAKIILKNREKLTVPEDIALRVRAAVLDNNILPTDYLELPPPHLITKGAVDTVISHDHFDDDTEKGVDWEEEAERRKKEDEVYEKHILWLCRRPVEDKVKDVKLATMIWMAYTGNKTIPENIRIQIEERQRDHFTKYRAHPYANPLVYRDVFTIEPESELANGYLKLCSNIYLTAMATAKKLSYL